MLTLSSELNFFNDVEKHLLPTVPLELVSFTNPIDLVDFFVNNYAHIVVLDIDLLKEDVIKLVDILRSIRRNSQIILLLSQKDTAICSRVFSRGGCAYQIKPVSTNAFCQLIKSTLQISQNQN